MPSLPVGTDSTYTRPSDVQGAADAIPILVDDVYHVFHLTSPPNTIHHPPRLRSSYSRMRSTDLATWERDRVPALLPGKTTDAHDADGAWTGCALLGPDGNMHIVYTGYNISKGGKQVILHAVSQDRHGTVFTKLPSAVSISGDKSLFEDIDFRDPYVFWNESENCYWMLVATRLRNGPHWTRGCIALLTSDDLYQWTIDPKPLYAPNDMFCPECPELFSLPNGKWYLAYSRFQSPNAGTVYRISDSPRGPFRTPRRASGGRLDARRWYAAKSCPKIGDATKRVYFGWVADRCEEDGKWLWGGDMGIPREVSADENGYLKVQPSQEYLDAAFTHGTQLSTISSSMKLSAIGTTKTQFFPISKSSRLIDYYFTFNISAHDAASFGLLFRADDDMKGHRLRFEPSSAPGSFDITLLASQPPLDDFWADQYKLYIPREVDGPELARHNQVAVEGVVTVVVQADVLEIFVGGRSFSYRLPASKRRDVIKDRQDGREGNGIALVDAHNEVSCHGEEHDLGIFVEDGMVTLSEISLRILRT